MSAKAPAYDSTGIEYHTIPTFEFSNGTTLHDVKVAYRSFNADSKAGTVLIPTCYSGWINTTLTFTDDSSGSSALSKYHVVVAAMLGNGESSSPSNKPFFPEAGELHYEDVIRAHHHLLTSGLGVTHIEAVVGFSMGGQQAYHWAVMFPDFVRRSVGICTSARTSPHNYAFLEGPIAALANSIDYVAWKEVKRKVAHGESVGENLKDVRPKKGLVGFGRAYSAWLTSAEWFNEGHWKGMGFDTVEGWVQNQGEGKLGWDGDDLLVLARMWQMADVGKTAKGELGQLGWKVAESSDDEKLHAALKGIKCPVLLLPARTDQYFRPEANEDEAKYLQHGTVHVIESTWGHLAGGGANPVDTKFMGDKISEFIASSS